MTINTSSTSQPSIKYSIKYYIFTNMPVNCLFMVQFSKLKVLQKADTLLDTSRLGSIWNLGAQTLQNWLSWAVMPALRQTDIHISAVCLLVCGIDPGGCDWSLTMSLWSIINYNQYFIGCVIAKGVGVSRKLPKKNIEICSQHCFMYSIHC